MNRRITAWLCAFVCIASFIPIINVTAEQSEKALREAAQDAIEWKEKNDSPYYGIGTQSADLYIMALRRMGRTYDYGMYLGGLDGIAAGYGAEHNASSMQRTALATIASGGDARNVGGRDMIADGVYYRNNVSPIDKEGVDGLSWGLIALDAGNFETPQWALTNRNDLIAGILSHQNTDGSFDGSVYSTAAALTALAPYCETSGAYTVTQNQTGDMFDISPAEAADRAMGFLSDSQSRDGDFGDLKSTAMTVIALDSIGVNPDDDIRFVAKDGSAVDGLIMYQSKDGGFSSNLNRSDGEATSMALCALASRIRTMQNKSAFFRFNVNDNSNVLSAPAATVKPNTSSGNTSRATSKPSKATVRPKTTVRPRTTTKPSASPSASARPTSTPRPTRRPALVGPAEDPGPMPTRTPMPEKSDANKDNKHTGAAAIVIGVLAIAALIVIGIFAVRAKGGKTNLFLGLFGKNKKKKSAARINKNRRKTAQHRKYEQRRKFEERKKYAKRG